MYIMEENLGDYSAFLHYRSMYKVKPGVHNTLRYTQIYNIDNHGQLIKTITSQVTNHNVVFLLELVIFLYTNTLKYDHLKKHDNQTESKHSFTKYVGFLKIAGVKRK